MKLRLTPLNIVMAISLATLAAFFFQVKSKTNVSETMVELLLVALIVVSFVTDLIFRFTLKSLKRIWMIESIFIVLSIILFLILQK